MDHFQIITHSATDTRKVGREIGKLLQAPIIIALSGDLGSGKTAFVQGLASGLDVPADYYITSPTFTLINEYPGRLRLFHVDLYRIETTVDLEEIGLYDILQDDGVVAIEWADKLPDGLLSERLAVDFKIIDDDTRKISVLVYGQIDPNLIRALERLVQTDRSKSDTG